MATRTIATRMAIEGESQYTASLKKINSELKLLQSSLKLTESTYKSNANSLKALEEKETALNKVLSKQNEKVKNAEEALKNANKAVKEYEAACEKYTKEIQANNEALERLKSTTGDTAEEEQRLISANQELNEKLDKSEQHLAAAQKGANKWQINLNNAKVEVNNTNAALEENKKYLEEAQKSTDKCATSIDQFGKTVKNTAGSTEKTGKEIKKFGNENEEASKDVTKHAAAIEALAAQLVASGLKESFDKIVEALKACIKASTEFESAMAGVAKTTDLTDTELADMGNAIQELATKIPATTTEIAGVTEAAGQLGIKKEDLLSFTEVMVNLGVATNLSSDEAASALAKFANVVNMSADDYDRLGSTIVDLGNNFATTEADIVSMATRLASTGAIVGLSEAEIMAVATALSSVGIEAEAGGSAISKLMKQFETMVQTGSDDLEAFAEVAGMSAQEFAQAWSSNPIQALDMFISGLHEVDQTGGSAVSVLEELGIKEVRLSNAVLSLASSDGILTEALNTANKAWSENTALTKEAETRYATTESKLQMFSNSVNNVKIAVGNQLTPALANLADAGTDVAQWAADFIEKNDAIVPVLTAVVAALGFLTVAITTCTVAVNVLIPAIQAFNSVLAQIPFGSVALAIGMAVTALGALMLTVESTTPTVKELTTAAQEASDAFDNIGEATASAFAEAEASAQTAQYLIDRLKELETQTNLTKGEEAERSAILSKLVELVPELSEHINAQTGEILTSVDAIEQSTKAWAENYKEQAKQSALKEYYEKVADAQKEVIQNTIEKSIADGEAEEAAQAHADAVARMNEIMDEATEEAERLSKELGYAVDPTDLLTQEYRDLENSLADLAQQEYDAREKSETYQEAIEKGNEELVRAEEVADKAGDAIENLGAAVDGTTAVTEDLTNAQNENSAATAAATAAAQELAESYAEEYESAAESINGQIGLFDDFADSVAENSELAQEALDNMAAQAENLATYTENLQKAAQYGLDEGLILSLSDGSADSAKYLSSIIKGIEELGVSTEGLSGDASAFVDQFNSKFAETEKAKVAFSETTAAMVTDFDKAKQTILESADSWDFSDIAKKINEQFAGIGENIGAGAVEGIENSTGEVVNATTNMMNSGTNAAKGAVGVHSPSTVFREIGQNIDQGLIDGIKSKQNEICLTTENLSKQITAVMTKSSKESVNKYIQEFSKIKSQTQKQINELKSTITNSMSGLPGSMRTIGANIVDGMISGMNNRSSSLYYTVSTIVNNAISRAKRAAATASPSKKTIKIFEDVGDGMIVGIQNKKEQIAQATQSVVDNALNFDTGKNKVNSLLSDISKQINDKKDTQKIEYDANIDYSAFMAEAKSIEEFIELSYKRNAKIIGENIDLSEKGWKTNAEILDQWLKESSNALNLSAETIQNAYKKISETTKSTTKEITESAKATAEAIEESAKKDYSSLMHSAKSLEEFLELSVQRNKKITDEGIDIAKHGWKTNAEILDEWLKSNSESVQYSAEQDYSALMAKAKTLEEFLELSLQRNAKIIDEGIDLAANGWESNAELLNKWMENNASDISDSALELAQALNLIGDTSGKSAESFTKEYQEAVDSTKETTEKLIKGVTEQISVLPDEFEKIGKQMSEGMAAGIRSGSSELYAEIKKVVDTAISTAKETAEVNSPSRRTQRLFEFIGDGMVLGLENRRKLIADTSKSIVDEALNLNLGKETKQEFDFKIPDMDSAIYSTSEKRSDSKLVNAVANLVKKITDAEKDGRTRPIEITVQSVLDGRVVSNTVTRHQFQKEKAYGV